jgi:hypothetical protein
VSDPDDPALLPEGLDLPAAEWQQTPLSTRLLVLTLLKRLEAFATRRHQNSSHSSRPPSTDSPATKRQRRMQAAERRQPGGKPGHCGYCTGAVGTDHNRVALTRSVCLWSS